MASPSSGLLGVLRSAGLEATNGGWNQIVSEFESVFPGSSDGPRKSRAMTA